MDSTKLKAKHFTAVAVFYLALFVGLYAAGFLAVSLLPYDVSWGPGWPLAVLAACLLIGAPALIAGRRTSRQLDAVFVEKEGLVAGRLGIETGGSLLVFADGDTSRVRFDLDIEDGLYAVVRRNRWGGLEGIEVRRSPPAEESN